MHPPSEVLQRIKRLVDAWCDRRCLCALREVLQAWPLVSGLTDEWGQLVDALEKVRAFARKELTDDELLELDGLIRDVGTTVLSQRRSESPSLPIRPPMDIPSLHDATLLDLSLHWGKISTLTVRFRGHGHHVVLTVLDAKLLHCPHENPWGPSVSVNDVRSTAGSGAGMHRIAIEMQSGDTILVEGNAVEWAVERDSA